MSKLTHELIGQLHSPDAARQAEAMQALKRLAAQARVRSDLVDDVVADVAFKLANPEVIARISESAHGYVLRMLANRAKDAHRREASAARAMAKLAAAAAKPVVWSDPEEDDRAERLFDQALAALLAHPGGRDADELRERFAEIRALSSKALTMEALAEKTRKPGEAWKTARDRLYQQHKRARDALLSTLVRLEQTGALSEEDGELVRAYLRGKKRRAVRSAPNARPGGQIDE